MATEGPPQNLATTLSEITERTTTIVRDEIELAKAEVRERLSKLGRGAAVALVAGVFVVTGLLFVLHGVAWLLYVVLDVDVFWGYFIVAAGLFVLGGVAGYLALRWLRGGSPPKPEMAIEEAQRVRATVAGEPLPHEEAIHS